MSKPKKYFWKIVIYDDRVKRHLPCVDYTTREEATKAYIAFVAQMRNEQRPACNWSYQGELVKYIKKTSYVLWPGIQVSDAWRDAQKAENDE